MSVEAMKQALEALEYADEMIDTACVPKAVTNLRIAIEQAEKQAPVAWPIDNQHAERIAERHCVSYEVVQLIAREILTTPQPQRKWVGTVDCIGLALDLEAQAKRVESQTVERAMLAAANGLRIIDKESKA